MTLQQLETRYADLLNAQLKEIPEQVNTFFDIAGFPQREKVLSNILAYYLNPAADHGFEDLFLTVLNNLIAAKSGRPIIQNTNNCQISTEVLTTKGNFIDLVIEEKGDTGTLNAIIIENKVNAPLYNDLTEYYNHITVSQYKIGVLLSRRTNHRLPPNYICITHAELIGQIEQAAGTYFLDANIRQIVFLKEFLQNIKNMSQNDLLKPHYDFLFRNPEKIRELSELYNTIRNDVLKQAEDACQMLDLGLKIGMKNSPVVRHYYSSKSPVYFSIWLDDLFLEARMLYIFVELEKQWFPYLNKINKIKFSKEEEQYLDQTTEVDDNQVHYATLELRPSTGEIHNLSAYIVEQITQTPLKSIFLKIENLLSSNQ
jgi:hypothetical protein